MKRSKIFVGAASFALAIGAFLATKANKKAFGVTSVYAIGLGKVVTAGNFSSSVITTTVKMGHTAFLVTATTPTTKRTLRTSNSGTAAKWYAK